MEKGSKCIHPCRVSILGVEIDPLTMGETVARAAEFADAGEFAHFIGVNADKLLQMRDDAAMDSIVRRCEVINADGASMLIAAKKLGVDLPERVAGIDLMVELCRLANKSSYGIFLLGARQSVVEETAEALLDRFPDLMICGMRNGYFGDSEIDEVAESIKRVSPDIVFVGITSPRKEQVIEKFRQLGLKGVFVGVGGSFDVISGNIKRAPLWMQKAKLEWFFRMCQEPKRLVGRYLIGNLRFMALLLKNKKGIS